MIKAETIIIQLQNTLPTQTTLFTDPDISISSLTRSGSTVTAITVVDHKLTTGNFVTVKNAKSPISVVSIIRVGTVATVTTATNHDFTEGFEFTAEIVGADQSEYNGIFDIDTVPNRKTFTFTVADTAVTPATGTILILNTIAAGYNGRHEVTRIDNITFTYEITQTPDSPAQGSPVIATGLRISGAVTMAKAVDSYTQMDTDELWGFVVLGDTIASKSRDTKTDLTAILASGDDFRQTFICSFSVFVITPSTDTIAGREVRDQMEDVAVALFKSLLRTKLENVLTTKQQYSTIFVGHSFVDFVPAYYVHQFQFEVAVDLVYADTIPDDFNVAYRDTSIDWLNPNETDNDNIIMEAEIDHDDVPL